MNLNLNAKEFRMNEEAAVFLQGDHKGVPVKVVSIKLIEGKKYPCNQITYLVIDGHHQGKFITQRYYETEKSIPVIRSLAIAGNFSVKKSDPENGEDYDHVLDTFKIEMMRDVRIIVNTRVREYNGIQNTEICAHYKYSEDLINREEDVVEGEFDKINRDSAGNDDPIQF